MAESNSYKRLKRKFQPAQQTMPANWSYKKKMAGRHPRSEFGKMHRQMKTTFAQGYKRESFQRGF